MTDVTHTKAEKSQRVPSTPSPSISSEAPPTNGSLDEFPILFRGFSGQGAEQAKENWQAMKSAAEKLTATVQGSYSTAAKESMDYGVRLIETARANTGAAIELANALLAAKSPSEMVELSSAHARRQLDVMVEQNRQLWAAAQKVAAAMIVPLNGSGPKASK